ncbi:hypothetical protein HanPI659440_Chr06g0231421 [Helianthus annuus]|nr:hypothetical protein HanPI659440_Chr06g0231421 [Helianthus annuus]
MISNAGTFMKPRQEMDTQMKCLKFDKERDVKCIRMILFIHCVLMSLNVCGECRLCGSRRIIKE